MHATLATLWALAPGAFPAPAALDAGPSLAMTLGKALFPIAAYLALAPVLWLFFRRTWRELDVTTHEHQKKTLSEGSYNYRPIVLFVITALVLTLQEYYGGRDFYDEHIKSWLRTVEVNQLVHPGGLGALVNLKKYNDLYGYAWWSFARCSGYVAFPMVAWKIF
ncbi:MAG: hypothetical protein ABJE95_32295, partial [Byssovorax sp.]